MAFVVAGIGELLWDYLPDGKALGGAPANFSYHAQVLGAESYVVSSIGNDNAGLEILSLLKKMNISDEFISVIDHIETGSVYVTIDRNGIPDYKITENVAWDFLTFSPEHVLLAQRLDAVCFGTLAQRSGTSRSSIESFLKNVGPKVIKVFDLNFRKNFYSKDIVKNSLSLSSVVKMSQEELDILIGMLGGDLDHSNFIFRLMNDFKIDLLALTKGAQGSVLYCDEECFEHPGYSVDVCDTIGAGDAFTAALTMGILHKKSLEEISNFANKVSSVVCMHRGATPFYGKIKI